MNTISQLDVGLSKKTVGKGHKGRFILNNLLNATALITALLLLAAAPTSVGASDNALKFQGWTFGQDSYGPLTDTPPLAPPCRPDAAWRHYGVGNGIFTHLGKVEISTTHCTYVTDFAGDPPTPVAGVFGPSRTVLTAAPGDELYMTFSGAFHIEMSASGPISVLDPITWTITGGTGRFLHANGSGSAHGTGDIVKNVSSLNWTGTISYDASDRAKR